jgi:hypothetical protein
MAHHDTGDNKIFACSLYFDTLARELAVPVTITRSIQSMETGADAVRSCKAIFDTGATSSMISSDIARALHLQSIDTALVTGVHGTERVPIYTIDVRFKGGFVLPTLHVAEAGADAGFDLLLGMDVIARGSMLLSSHDKRTLFAFFYPQNR